MAVALWLASLAVCVRSLVVFQGLPEQDPGIAFQIGVSVAAHLLLPVVWVQGRRNRAERIDEQQREANTAAVIRAVKEWKNKL